MSTNMTMLFPEATPSHFNIDAYHPVNAISRTACTCQRIDQPGAPAVALGTGHANGPYTQQSWDIDVHDSGLSSSMKRNNDSTALAAWQPAWLGFWMSKIGRKVNAADIALFRSLLGVTEEAVRLCLQEWLAYGNADHMHTCKAVQDSSVIPLEHTIPTTTHSMNLLRVDNTRNNIDRAQLTHQSLQSYPIQYRSACSSSGPQDCVQHKFTGAGHKSRGKEPYVEQPVQIPGASTADLAWYSPASSGRCPSVSTKQVRDLINQIIERQATKGCGRIRGHENQRGKYPCTLGCGRRFKNSADAFRHEEIVYPQQFFFDVTRGDPSNPSEKDIFAREDKMRQRLKKANDTSISLDQCRVSNIRTLWPERCGLCTHHRHPNWKERTRHILWHCRRGDFNTSNRRGGSSPSAELTQSAGDDDEDGGDDDDDEHSDADDADDQHDGPEDPTDQRDGPGESDSQRDDHGDDLGNNDYEFPPWSDDYFDTWLNNSSDMWKHSKTIHIECVHASIRSSVTAKVLKIVGEEVNVDISELADDTAFVDLGVDSLLWVTIISRLREELTIDIPLSLFFRCSTLGELKKHFGQVEDHRVSVDAFGPDLTSRNAHYFCTDNSSHGHLVFAEPPDDRKVDPIRPCKEKEELLSQLARARDIRQVASTDSISVTEEVDDPDRRHDTLHDAFEHYPGLPGTYQRLLNKEHDSSSGGQQQDSSLEHGSSGGHYERDEDVYQAPRRPVPSIDTNTGRSIYYHADAYNMTCLGHPFIPLNAPSQFALAYTQSAPQPINIGSPLHSSPISPYYPEEFPQGLPGEHMDRARDTSSPYLSVSDPFYPGRRRASTRSSRAPYRASDFSIEERSAFVPIPAPVSKSSRFQCTSTSHEKTFTRKADWRRHEIEIHGEKSKEQPSCLDSSSSSFTSSERPPQYSSALCGYRCGWSCCPESDEEDNSIETHGPKLSAVIHGTQDLSSSSGVTTCEHCDRSFTGRYRRGNMARHVHQHHSDKDALGSTTSASRLRIAAFTRQDARWKHEWKKDGLENSTPLRRGSAFDGISSMVGGGRAFKTDPAVRVRYLIDTHRMDELDHLRLIMILLDPSPSDARARPSPVIGIALRVLSAIMAMLQFCEVLASTFAGVGPITISTALQQLSHDLYSLVPVVGKLHAVIQHAPLPIGPLIAFRHTCVQLLQVLDTARAQLSHLIESRHRGLHSHLGIFISLLWLNDRLIQDLEARILWTTMRRYVYETHRRGSLHRAVIGGRISKRRVKPQTRLRNRSE